VSCSSVSRSCAPCPGSRLTRSGVALGHGETAAQGRPVEELRVGQQVYRPGEEAIKREVLIGAADPGAGGTPGQRPDQERSPRLHDLIGQGQRWAIDVPAGTEQEPLGDGAGQVVGALIRTWQPLQGAVEVTAAPLDIAAPGASAHPGRLYQLTASIVNTTPWTWPAAERGPGAALQPRQAALRQTCVSTHTILRVSDGQFVSLLEPEAEYQEAAQGCANSKTWPVLVGEQGDRHTILSSPIILYDYPEVAPESPGHLFDGTEIDELLTISIMALTDAEKQEMRESEPRARELLERTEALLPDQLSKLHGAVRSLRPVRRPQG